MSSSSQHQQQQPRKRRREATKASSSSTTTATKSDSIQDGVDVATEEQHDTDGYNNTPPNKQQQGVVLPLDGSSMMTFLQNAIRMASSILSVKMKQDDDDNNNNNNHSAFVVDTAATMTRNRLAFFETFDWMQAVYLPPPPDDDDDSSSNEQRRFTWQDVQPLFQRLNTHDQHSWCVETPPLPVEVPGVPSAKDVTHNDNNHNHHHNNKIPNQIQQQPEKCSSTNFIITPDQFWTNEQQLRGYCSFLVQHDRMAYQETLERLPLQDVMSLLVDRQPCPNDDDAAAAAETTATTTSTVVEVGKHQPHPLLHLVYEPCLWFFFGCNPILPPPPTRATTTTTFQNHDDDDEEENKNTPKNCQDNNCDRDLQGRPDHTDSISHDGTWHYQLSGLKRWYLRPTVTLLQHWKERHQQQQEQKSSSDSSTTLSSSCFLTHCSNDIDKWLQDPDQTPTLCIECQEGDVLVVNTRLWWHRTVLPPQSTPSVSYARDFHIHPSNSSNTSTCATRSSGKDVGPHNDDTTAATFQPTTNMTNLDGLYARNDIEEGTILFTERDMPNCELHRSADHWNCQVVELDDGTSAVVSTQPIAAGEFFCVPESEEDDDDDENEDEEDMGDEEEEGEDI